MATPTQRLTLKQRRFVEEYFKDSSSARAAAARAGYKEHSARGAARSLLKHPVVQEELEELHNIRKNRLGVTEDRILLEMSRIAFADLGNVVTQDEHGNLIINLDSLTSDQTAALSEISKSRSGTKVKNYDKLAALVHIGKHIGMFREKVEVQGKLSLEQLVLDSFKKKDEDTEN